MTTQATHVPDPRAGTPTHPVIDDLVATLGADHRVQAILGALLRAPDHPPPAITGLSGSFTALLVATLFEATSRQVLFVCDAPDTAERMHDDITACLRGNAARLYIHRDNPQRQEGFHDPGAIETLQSLLEGSACVVVTHPSALVRKHPAPSRLRDRSVTLTTGDEQPFGEVVARIVGLGFSRTDFVQTCGDVAVRGGILDIFPFVGEHPVRVEFSGDTIDSIREFDPLSQRSIKQLAAATIVPDLLAQAGDATGSLFDFLREDALCILHEPGPIRTALEREAARLGDTAFSPDQVGELLRMFPVLSFSSIREGGAIDFGTASQPSFNGSIRLLYDDLVQRTTAGTTVTILCGSQSELARLRDLLSLHADNPGGTDLPAPTPEIRFSLEALHEGFLLPDRNLAVYTEHQLFNRLKRRGRKVRAKFKGLREGEIQKLGRGDLVVHMDYGIGKYDGLHRIRVRTVEQEVVKILYEDNDTLYLNLNYLNRLQKYSSTEGHTPKLTKLGSGEWDRLKSRAKKRIKDIARDLITLYAKRKQSPGMACAPDTPWQKEMEASFMYEDTFDQARATRDVKEDMESPHPMDRLVCGDVGFGKTEVAVRAAFKAINNSLQVGVLVPTTILAMQHFNTFLDRLGRYGVRVAVLSRFKTRNEQRAITDDLAAGAIDVVIGTHRLLSADVRFRNLGLLIVDEEHRFGVAAKEKLRHRKSNVDTLTLTATPIPRTLHFSLMGARDLSVIATPPRNRLPVITEITVFADDLIREAVQRELQRGGQVYFVHDRVHTITAIAERLEGLLPGVRIRCAHGQMESRTLEQTMLDFLEKRFDVLVCTKIIESGLDIPNANTIIINRADRFGMAELYQLRGRVGRSNQQAYAYLLTPPIGVLPRETIRRLQAVEEHTDLGSGFNLAMRDLEIRGTGNLLGAEQSGFAETMGFDTYTRLLEEAVSELKQEEFANLFADRPVTGRTETIVDVDVDALLPEHYVENATERLTIYRRLYGVQSPEQLAEIEGELRDRFGGTPPEVDNLLTVIRIRLAAAKLGFPRVSVDGARMETEFPPETVTSFYDSPAFQRLMKEIPAMHRSGVLLRQDGSTLKLHVPLREPDSLHAAYAFLDTLYATVHPAPAPPTA